MNQDDYPEVLRDRPSLMAAINQAPDAYRIELSKKGDPVPVRIADERWIGSRYDPVRELSRWYDQDKPEEGDLPVFLGFVPSLLRVVKNRPLVIAEHDASLLKVSLPAVTEPGLWEGVTLVRDVEGMSIQSAVRDSFDPFVHSRVKVYRLPHVEDENWTALMARSALDIQKEVSMNMLSYSYQLPLWLRTVRSNLEDFVHGPDASPLFGSLSGYTAVVIAAGPSLDRNKSLLRELKGKYVTIAVDTALRALDSAGIVPDIAVAIDANEANAKDVDGLSDGLLNRSLLCADQIVTRDLVKAFTGRKVFLRTINYALDVEGRSKKVIHPLDQLLIDLIGRDLPSWQSGGSVSTNALSLARLLGCSTVVLVGHDLAFTGGKTHVKGVGYEDSAVAGLSRFFSREDYFRRRLEEGEVIVPALGGGSVMTSPVMREFIRWYELTIKYGFARDLRVIDATEGGARKEGTEIMTLRNAIQLIPEGKEGGARLGELLDAAPAISDEGFDKNLKELGDKLDEAERNPEKIDELVPLARWLALRAFIGRAGIPENIREEFLRNSTVSGVKYIRKVFDL